MQKNVQRLTPFFVTLILSIAFLSLPACAKAEPQITLGSTIQYALFNGVTVRNDTLNSSSPYISISSDGRYFYVRAIKPGRAVYSRYWEEKVPSTLEGDDSWEYKHREYTVTVVQPMTSFNIAASISVYMDHAKTLQVSRKPATSEVAVTFQSSNQAIATVNVDGVVTGVKAGTCVITASSSGCASRACVVSVKPNPLEIVSVTPSSTDTIARQKLKWDTAVQYGSGSKTYAYSIYRNKTIVKQTGFSTAASCAYVPVYGGTYYACCYVKDALNTVKMTSAVTTVNVRPLTVDTCTVSAPIPCVGQPLNVAITVNDGEGDYRYRYFVYCNETLVYDSKFQSKATLVYTPKAEGVYYVSCVAGSANENVQADTAKITVGAKLSASVKAAKTGYANESIIWYFAKQGGFGTATIAYEVYLGSKKVASVACQADVTSFTYKAKEIGTYRLVVKVKDTSASIAVTSAQTAVKAKPITGQAITIQGDNPYAGYRQRWSATYDGGYGALQFRYIVSSGGKILYNGQYGTKPYLDYTPVYAGVYQVKAYIKDQYSAATVSNDFTILSVEPSLRSVTANATSVALGSAITWTASGTGMGTLAYTFTVYLNGMEIHQQNTGAAATLTYTPRYTGTYTATCTLSNGAKAARLNSDAVNVVCDRLNINAASISGPCTETVGGTMRFTLNCEGTTDQGTFTVTVLRDGEGHSDFTLERQYSGAVVLVNASVVGTYSVKYQYTYNQTQYDIDGGSCVVTEAPVAADIADVPQGMPAAMLAPAGSALPSPTLTPEGTVCITANGVSAVTETLAATEQPVNWDSPATTEPPTEPVPVAPVQTEAEASLAEAAPASTEAAPATNDAANHTPTPAATTKSESITDATPIITPTPTPTPEPTPAASPTPTPVMVSTEPLGAVA